MLKKILLLCGLCITLVLLWFAISNYRAAFPIAEENLRGMALSITAAVENIAAHDPSLHLLDTLHPKDLAFLAIVDQSGIFRFHTNADLIGSRESDSRSRAVLLKGEAIERRVTLGTGEKAYEFISPLHIAGKPLILRLTLHTYRADAVIRQAELNMFILLSLLLAGWVLSALIYRYAVREEMHHLAMARQESLARLGEMGAMLAHEIRNPLGGIKGFAQVIEKRPTDERNRGFAQRIVAETLRLEALVNNLLAYSRTDRLAPTVLRLDELIAHTVSLIRPEAEEQQIAIFSDCPEGLQIQGDRDRLGQVLLNLAKNAIQAMPEGGSLNLVAAASAMAVTIAVSDSGQGIEADIMDRIFEPFFTTRSKGTGLGLALCKKIVEEHSGTIGVKSVTGQGTTISITLPARLP
ncbi:MAG: histidine kinase [Geobacter sp.]|nr:histidine kinase [Geobacter sp.]